MNSRSSRPAGENGIARLERIANAPLPTLPAPPVNPTVQEAMEAWMAMARGYGSIVVRQHEFERAQIDVLRSLDRRLGDMETSIDAITQEVRVDVAPAAIPAPPEEPEAPTVPR